MFLSSISFMNVGTAAAGFLMPNISGDSYNGVDDSFIITLRALLFDRMDANDTLHFEIKDLPIPYESFIKRMEFGRPDCFTVYYTKGSTVPAYKFIDDIRNTFSEKHAGYERQDKITLFFKSVSNETIGVVPYINKQTRSVVVFMNRLHDREYHLLQVTIPTMMPWYFDGESGVVNLEDEDKAVIKALSKKNADEYKMAIVDIFDKIAESLSVRIVCPVCGERGLRPAPYGNHFCERCFTLFRSDGGDQFIEVRSMH